MAEREGHQRRFAEEVVPRLEIDDPGEVRQRLEDLSPGELALSEDAEDTRLAGPEIGDAFAVSDLLETSDGFIVASEGFQMPAQEGQAERAERQGTPYS